MQMLRSKHSLTSMLGDSVLFHEFAAKCHCAQVLFWMWGHTVTSACAKGTHGDLERPHLICGNLNKWSPWEFSRGLWKEPLGQRAPRNGLSLKWHCTSPIQLDKNFWFYLLQSKNRTVGEASCTPPCLIPFFHFFLLLNLRQGFP